MEEKKKEKKMSGYIETAKLRYFSFGGATILCADNHIVYLRSEF